MSSYLKRLLAFRASQRLALRESECVRDLVAMSPDRAAELAQIEAAITKRKEYIATITADIAKAQLS